MIKKEELKEQIGTVIKAGNEAKADGSGFLFKLQVEKYTYTLFAIHHQEIATSNLGKRVKVMYEMDKSGKYRNVQSITPALDEVSSGGAQMSPEAWAKKDRLEQWSRECNTCFMGIADLLKVDHEFIDGGKQKEVYNAALDWVLAHLRCIPPVEKLGQPQKVTLVLNQALKDSDDLWPGDPPNAKAAAKAAEEATQETELAKEKGTLTDLSTITSIEKLAAAIKRDFGLSYKEMWAELNIDSWNDLAIPLAEAYQQVANIKRI